jgi:hypothetical protein
MTIRFETAIGDHYDELADVAEDIGNILTAIAGQHLDLSPTTQVWLLEQLEQVESMLCTLAELKPRGSEGHPRG